LPAPLSRAIVSAIVQMAHSYGGRVLAECVETAEQADAARELGVDLGQGWFFGRPEERPRQQRPGHTVGAGTPAGWAASPEHAGIDLAVPS
jgi:EAL domain-containing protein (putative c-di-GMP-specific phosphodiesterase class I)